MSTRCIHNLMPTALRLDESTNAAVGWVVGVTITYALFFGWELVSRFGVISQ